MLFQRLLLLTIIFAVVSFASAKPTLPAVEVGSLRAMAQTLGKKDWDFLVGVDPCTDLSNNWVDPNPDQTELHAVVCDCTFVNNTICHVVKIYLQSQNLTGLVPREIAGLPFLQEIDLSRNYLRGSIPPEWGSIKLKNISLFGNRVTGSIPEQLANITTLETLNLEGNHLSGTIPPALGNLPQLKILTLTANNLTGEIPANLANLVTLTQFRISDNNFVGQIPEFIQNWTGLEKLVMQGSGLTGPIPRGISSLTKLVHLKISNLNGKSESAFPPISNSRMLQKIILSSCNIVGELPSYIGKMTKLKVLDLSFNKLSGPIPDSFYGLRRTNYIYLTGNSLSGRLPVWMLTEGDRIDLSYNNLTSEDSNSSCQLHKLNLFASSKGNASGSVSCLRSVPCNKKYTSLHINCGGSQVVDDNGTTYEADTDPGGPSNFYLSKTNWGFSSTGHFMGDDSPIDSFIWSMNGTNAGLKSQLYTDARLSPLSLTYYAFCLMNGNYTIKLHFTKIRDTNGSIFLGRRVFDVYIQGNRVLKDFELNYEMGAVKETITRNFTVAVDDNTLDIQFHWTGKGTMIVPFKVLYGPLISAISVDPNFIPPLENGKSISTGAIVGIAVAVIFTICLSLTILWWRNYLPGRHTMHDLKGLDLHIGSFTLRQIKAATNNFDPANKIGEGGFGPVYKGHLKDGTIVAVKQLSAKSKQGNREFVNEIGLISAVQHPHLVKLYGCSVEGDQLLLVYEFLENNSLARALFGPKEQQLHLDWPTRNKICIGIAKGLAHLHGDSRVKIVHRDIKATNVLLDKYLVPKISDFGLAKLHEEDNSHISTRVAGTFGYMAPEYVMRGYLTDKADVYSFGVVLFEIVSGRSNVDTSQNDDCFCLLDWVDSLKEKGNLLELLDPRLQSNFDEKEVTTTLNVAVLCTNIVPKERPSMATVVSILEGEMGFEDFVIDSNPGPQDESRCLDDDV